MKRKASVMAAVVLLLMNIALTASVRARSNVMPVASEGSFIRDLRVKMSPEYPTIYDEVSVNVSFWILEAYHFVDFGGLAQVGNAFAVDINVSLTGLPIAGPWVYNHTYSIGRLSQGSYWFSAYVYVYLPGTGTAVLLTSTTELFKVTDWWPMFHQNLRHTGHSNSKAPNTNSTPWSYTTGNAVLSSPAVADGMVFASSGDSNVYGLNETTGSKVWNYTTGGGIFSSPAVADGMVFVGSAGDYNVYALNETTGDKVWNYTVSGTLWDSSPAVADGLVFIGSSDRNVYALNETTGDKVWNYTTGGGIYSSPAVADGMVFIGSLDGSVYGLNETTGSKIWSTTLGDMVEGSSPAVADGMVFIGSRDHNVYALNETTGDKIWGYATGDEVFSSPAVADGMVFAGSWDNNVYALNETTGDKIWSYTTGLWVFSSPAVADGLVFIGSSDGKVYAFGSVHDVAVKNVAPSKSVVGQGYSLSISVTAANLGILDVTFNITTRANATSIARQETTLASLSSATIAFTWNTTGFTEGNYTIWAYAEPVQDEADTTDNNFTDGVVHVGVPGNVNYFDGSRMVDMIDLWLVQKYYGAVKGKPGPLYVPNYDIDDSGKIDMIDLWIAQRHFGQTEP